MAAVSSNTRERKPHWIHRSIHCGPEQKKVEELLSSEALNTVCVGAKCPNKGECFSRGTATFMIMGDVCTRNCRFCAVPSGPVKPLREDEPEAVARAALSMGLSHVVITSVSRDDLMDGGAGHFAKTVEAVRDAIPGVTVEVLAPDFSGDEKAVDIVLAVRPDVFNHNIETVERLYPDVRPEAEFSRSLAVLARAGRTETLVKSGFMVGLGESFPEVTELLGELKDTGCSMVTVGQYLQPTKDSLPVESYWVPDDFEALTREARNMGFKGVAAGPFVRSSYFAHDMLGAARGRHDDKDKEI